MKTRKIQQAIIYIIFPLTGILLLPYFQYELTPDSVSYLSIAEKYSHGDLLNAVNRFWPPLISWLAIPFLWLNAPPIIAGKLVMILSGIVLLVAVRKILIQWKIADWIICYFLCLLIFIIYFFSFSMTTADMLLTAVLAVYLSLLFSPLYKEKLRYGIYAGIAGALCYLAKHYAFFFFSCHFILFTIIFYGISEREVKKMILKNFVAGISVFLILCALWTTALSIRYHSFTVSMVGKYNFTFIGPHTTHEHKPVIGGFFVPPNSTAINVWEDPSDLHWKTWNPFSSAENFRHYIKRIYFNWYRTYLFIVDFSPLLLGIVIVALLFILREKSLRNMFNNKLVWLFATILLYLGGYCLIFTDYRFVWPACILLLLIGALLLSDVFSRFNLSRGRKILFLAILGLFFLFFPLKSLFKNLHVDKDMADMAALLATKYNVKGAIASNANWFQTLFISFHLKNTYYGAAEPAMDQELLVTSLKELKINYYIEWKAYAVNKLPPGYEEITKDSIPSLRIYKIK
jgi:hypothetical protein